MISPLKQRNSGPLIRTFMLGEDSLNGESRQLKIPAGYWRYVELPDDDLNYAATYDGDRVGMLMSEVCIPGFRFVRLRASDFP